jgi:signal transduction histidine kinase
MDAGPAFRQPWRLSEPARRWLDRAIVVLPMLPVPFLAIAGGWTVALLATAQLVPLWWRRAHPVPVFAAVAAASAAQVPLTEQPLHAQVAFPIALYSVARYASVGPAAVALGVGLIASAVASVDWLIGFDSEVRPGTFAPYFLTMAGIVVTAWALGTQARTRRAYVDALVERGERIELEAAQQIELAALDERARIAREMHDVVAHGLSVMVVQADGARYAAARDPGAAERALETISATGRDALDDMRRLLGLLRSDHTGTAPAPRLAEIADLLTDVTADLHGLDTEVPPGVALTAYRVVQESLTNVRKHAGPGARPHVAVRVEDAVRITVEDDGRGAAAPHDGHGHGLRGMRERVGVHGGELEAGPRPGGGFRVAARIPL